MAKEEKQKITWHLHHQAVFDCPKCNEMIVEDLGEFPEAKGDEVTCGACGCEFELAERIE